MSEDVLHRPSDVTGLVVDTTTTPRRHALEVHVDRVKNVLVVSPVGDVDAVTGGLLLEALIAAISTGETRLIVDLDEARIIDSTAASIFLSANRAMAAVDGRLLIVASAGRRDAVGLSRLDEFLAVHPSVAAAVGVVKDG